MSSNTIQLNGSTSFETYLKFNSTDKNSKIFDYGFSSILSKLSLGRFDTSNNIAFYYDNSKVAGGEIVNNQLTHIVTTIGTIDSSSSNVKIYQDGNLLSLTTSDFMVPIPSLNYNLNIGKSLMYDTSSINVTSPDYYWDFRVNTSSSVIDKIGGLTATYNGSNLESNEVNDKYRFNKIKIIRTTQHSSNIFFVHFNEVQVWINGTNVALGRPTTSSSNYNSTFIESNLVNGNVNDMWHSANDSYPWALITLDQYYDI